MELVKKGYKKTEVGIIPNDWDNISIESAVVNSGLIRGPFGGALKKEFFVKDGFKVYEQKNAIYKSVELGDYFIDELKFKELKRFEICAGDFILSCSGTIGRIYLIPNYFHKGIINQALLIIRLDKNKINQRYFYYQFTSVPFQRKVIDDTQGGAMKNLIGMSEFRKVLIPLPPTLTEQKAIADALTDVDELITNLEKLIAKKKAIKQGAMQQLLTPPHKGGKRLDGFSGDWEEKTLGELAVYKNGKAHESCVVDYGKYIIVNSKFISSDGTVAKYSNELLCPVSKDEILMVLSDVPNGKAIAKCYFVKENNRYTLNQRICSLKPINVDAKFLYYLINRNKYFLSFDDGVKQTNLRNIDVLNCPLIIPPSIDEQRIIAEIITDMENTISSLELSLEKKYQIKQGMMQELLTGKTRLI